MPWGLFKEVTLFKNRKKSENSYFLKIFKKVDFFSTRAACTTKRVRRPLGLFGGKHETARRQRGGCSRRGVAVHNPRVRRSEVEKSGPSGQNITNFAILGRNRRHALYPPGPAIQKAAGSRGWWAPFVGRNSDFRQSRAPTREGGFRIHELVNLVIDFL